MTKHSIRINRLGVEDDKTRDEPLEEAVMGGVGGIINADKLGLDVIYIQAKRWENTNTPCGLLMEPWRRLQEPHNGGTPLT